MAEPRRFIAPTDHVDDRAMAAYIDGRLTGPAKAAVTSHLADCEDCRVIFAESARLRLASEQELESRPRRAWAAVGRAWHALDDRTRWVKPALVTASLAAAASITVVVQPQLARLWPGRSDVAELVAAVGTERRFEPRLTGGFEYGAVSPAPVVRGEASDDPLSADVRMAALKLEQQLKTRRSASTLRAYAAAQLVVGHADRAVPPLEEAARMTPHDPRIQSDLAAAYLVRFKDGNDLEDLTRAVAAASDATERDPKLREAQFNLALALEALSLPREARKAWQHYLEIDGGSPWAGEARRHLEKLAPDRQSKRFDDEHRRIADAAASGDAAIALAAVERLPDVAYEYVENELIPAWADAWIARNSNRAEIALREATLLSDAVRAAVGERMIADAIAAITHAATSGSRELDALARAHQTFRDARRLYAADKVTEAANTFKAASPAFERAGSPFSEWTTQYASIAEYYSGRLAEAARLLDPTINAAEQHHHAVLLGRALRMRGLVRQVGGDVGNSLDDYRHALLTFNAVGARDDTAAIHSSIADNLQAIGDTQQAAAHVREALALSGVVGDSRRRGAILHRGSQIALQWGDLPAALAIRNELVTEAEAGTVTNAAIDARHDRAEILRRMARYDAARADLDAASSLLASVSDPGLVARYDAELNLARGELASESNAAEALTPLKVSLAYFRDHAMDERLARVYLALGRAQRALARGDDAEATFVAGIGILDRQRVRLPNGALRLSYFEQPWNLYDELIDLLSGPLNRPAAGLAVAERARGRDLLESSHADAQPVDPVLLTRSLPPDVAVAYFVTLSDRVLVWVLRNGDASTHVLSVTARSLEATVAEFNTALQDSKPDADVIAMRLFDTVIAPWVTRVPTNATIVIVPDGPLHVLPFAALIDRHTRHRLIQDHAVATTPSATMLVRAQRSSTTAPVAQNARLLVIGNPTIDPEDATGLPNLSGAEGEAADILRLFPDAAVFTGSGATKRVFLERVAAHTIVHFAGHAIANEMYPILSRLLLARDLDGKSGNIFASELSTIDFRDTRLVVLAACGTAAGPLRKGEGPIGLARPFLARGVPSVVATLWDVDDAASRAFFRAFYSSLHAGAAPAGAVRAAQVAMLKHPDPRVRDPRAWAGFVNMGA